MDRKRLIKFLSEMADPKRLEDFKNNPDSVMQSAGLSNEEIELIKSKDDQRIRQALGAADEAAGFTFTIYIVLHF